MIYIISNEIIFKNETEKAGGIFPNWKAQSRGKFTTEEKLRDRS